MSSEVNSRYRPAGSIHVLDGVARPRRPLLSLCRVRGCTGRPRGRVTCARAPRARPACRWPRPDAQSPGGRPARARAWPVRSLRRVAEHQGRVEHDVTDRGGRRRGPAAGCPPPPAWGRAAGRRWSVATRFCSSGMDRSKAQAASTCASGTPSLAAARAGERGRGVAVDEHDVRRFGRDHRFEPAEHCGELRQRTPAPTPGMVGRGCRARRRSSASAGS